MRSTYVGFRPPHPVRAGANRRLKKLGYRSFGCYLTNLVRCDLIMQRGHELTTWLAAQSDADQDFIDDCLAEFPPSQTGSQSTLTHHFCVGIIRVMVARHRCTTSQALAFLPSAVRELCETHDSSNS